MDTIVFSKIEQRTVEKEVVTALREAIISGKLDFGTHLTEAELSSQMAVSRIPIREALRMLEQEGLVIRLPNRGCFVITFSPQDVEEVFSLRAALESMSFERAMNELEEADFAALQQIIRKQEESILAGDYASLANSDMQFHEYILRKTNHSRLVKAWYEQHALCRMLLNLRFRVWAEYTPATVLDDHKNLLQTLRNKDTLAAINLTKAISKRVSEECIQALEKISPHSR